MFAQITNSPDLAQNLTLTDVSTELLFRLGIDLLSVMILVRFIYYRIYRKSSLFLTFFVFNVVIFLITYLLNQVQLSIGAAFGLFAVFSMLRYRTEGLSAKDMTYLFVVIALGLIGAVSRGGLAQLALLNALILGCVYLPESSWLFKREFSKAVQYDRLDLMAPDRRAELLFDLRTRTGLPVHRIDVEEFDLLKDTARITVFYYPHAEHTLLHSSTETPVH